MRVHTDAPWPWSRLQTTCLPGEAMGLLGAEVLGWHCLNGTVPCSGAVGSAGATTGGRREPNLPCPVLQPSYCLGRIQVSSTTWELLGPQEEWESTGGIEVKGKGIMQAGFNT